MKRRRRWTRWGNGRREEERNGSRKIGEIWRNVRDQKDEVIEKNDAEYVAGKSWQKA